jgi:hypothetical protein
MFTNLGDGLLIWNIFETSYQNYPVRLFDLSFRVGSGKHERVHTSTVYEMTLPQQFPLMIIAAKEGIASWVERFSSQRVERVKLEGNFNNTFTTYAESGAQMEIRVILSPDDMALLIDEMSEHSFVFSENKVFVFYSGKMIDYIEELASEEEYKKQLGQIEKVILKWLPSLLRLHT